MTEERQDYYQYKHHMHLENTKSQITKLLQDKFKQTGGDLWYSGRESKFCLTSGIFFDAHLSTNLVISLLR